MKKGVKWIIIALIVIFVGSAAISGIKSGLKGDTKKVNKDVEKSKKSNVEAKKEDDKNTEDKHPWVKETKDPDEAIKKLNDTMLNDLQEKYGEDVIIDASAEFSGKDTKTIITVDNKHELLKGHVATIRNTTADLIQDAGLIKNRKVIVVIKWDADKYEYEFILGKGWNKDVQ